MITKPSYNQGFTLIEFTIVLIIAGLFIGALVGLALPYYKDLLWQRSLDSLAEIERGTKLFYAQNDRYPCPADPVLDNGEENCALSGIASQEWDGTPSDIIVGAVPYRTLGISERATQDGYGSTITYAVTRNSSTIPNFAELNENAGAVKVLNAMDESISRRELDAASPGLEDVWQHFFFFSQGPVACAASSLESENCDGDEIFRHMEQTHASGAMYYDDITRFYVFRDEDDIWRRVETEENDIRNLNARNVGIGMNPGEEVQEKLHIKGNVRADGQIFSNKLGTGNSNAAFVGLTVSEVDPLTSANRNLSYFIAMTARTDAGGITGVERGDQLGVFEARSPDSVIAVGTGWRGAGMAITATEKHGGGNMGSRLELRTVRNGEIRGNARVILDANGRMGISENASSAAYTGPVTRLDVDGEIKLSAEDDDANPSTPLPVTCPAEKEGAQRYNAGSKKMEFCDGTIWVSLETPQTTYFSVDWGGDLWGQVCDSEPPDEELPNLSRDSGAPTDLVDLARSPYVSGVRPETDLRSGLWHVEIDLSACNDLGPSTNGQSYVIWFQGSIRKSFIMYNNVEGTPQVKLSAIIPVDDGEIDAYGWIRLPPIGAGQRMEHMEIHGITAYRIGDLLP